MNNEARVVGTAIGIGVAIAVAIGLTRVPKPIAIPTPIPAPMVVGHLSASQGACPHIKDGLPFA